MMSNRGLGLISGTLKLFERLLFCCLLQVDAGGKEIRESHYDSWILRLRGWMLDGARKGKPVENHHSLLRQQR